MKKMILVACLTALSMPAMAGNDNSNGGCQGNCSGGSETVNNGGNGGNGYGGNGYGGDASSTGVGIGVGVGLGGEGGQGGEGGRGGAGGSAVALGGGGGSVHGSGNSYNLNKNDATAISGSVSGANAQQGQHQAQSNVGVNSQGQSSTNVLGQSTDASSKNDNRSTASGNTTNVGATTVGGQAASNTTNVSYRTERNAPPVFLGAITPTSCGGSFNAGGSSRDGAGGFGFSWVGKECAIRMVGDRYQQLGMVDTACEVYKSTKAFKTAAKRNPKLANLDCKVAPPQAPVTAPAIVFPETIRKPRG